MKFTLALLGLLAMVCGENNVQNVVRTIKENDNTGQRIFNVMDELAAAGAASRVSLRYNFRKSGLFDPSSLFSIESDVLTIYQPPDRERLCAERACDCKTSLCRVNFFVDVAKVNEEFVWRIINVTVNIDDVNDQPPTFPMPRYSINMMENDAQVQVDLPVATDQDYGTRICKYEVRDGEDSASKFNVIRKNDKHYLTVRNPLNREEKDSYNILLVATECGSVHANGIVRNGSTELTVSVKDVDDNAPQFTQSVYTVNVSEEVSVDRDSTVPILELRAHDPDEFPRITYSMQTTDAPFLLKQIDNEAHIELVRPLDYESRVQYNLTVTAQSGTFNATAYVVVNVVDANDHVPEIRFFDIQTRAFCNDPNVDECVLIRENLPADTPIAKVQVTDGDASREFGYVQCAVQADSGDSMLVKLQPTSNVTEKEARFTLLTARPFDREQETKVRAKIDCYNVHRDEHAATKTLMVIVGDVNDNAPVWPDTRVRVRVAENNAVGEQIGTVRASDADFNENGTVSYRLLPSADAQLVSIVSNASVGYVHARTAFDRERKTNVTLHVVAYDGGSPALNSTPLELVFEIEDVNDNVPQFDNRTYRFSVVENDSTPHSDANCRLVGKLHATDADVTDAGRLHYLVQSASGDKLANVDPTGFRIDTDGTLSVCAPLDRETQSSLTIVVLARDAAHHVATATVYLDVVDVNDCQPTLRGPTEFEMPADTQPGVIVAQLAAEDRDADENGRVFFRLVESSDNLFELDSSGTLKVRRFLTETDLTRTPFRLTVELSNGLLTLPSGEAMQNGALSKYTVTVRIKERSAAADSTHGDLQASNSERASGGGPHFLMIVFLVTIAGTLCIIVLLVVVFLKRDSLFKSAFGGAKVDEEAARGDDDDADEDRAYASAGSLDGSEGTYGELKANELDDVRPASSCSERLKTSGSSVNRAAMYTSYEPVLNTNRSDQSRRKPRNTSQSQFATSDRDQAAQMQRSRSFTNRAQRGGTLMNSTTTFALPPGYAGTQTPTMTARKGRAQNNTNMELVSVHNTVATPNRSFKSPFMQNVNNNNNRVMVCEKCDCPECVASLAQPLSLTDASSQQITVLPCFGAPLGAPCVPFGAADVYNTSQYCDYYTAERSMLRSDRDRDRGSLQKDADSNGNALEYRDANTCSNANTTGTAKMRQLVLLNGNANAPQTKVVPSNVACSTNVNSVATVLPETPKLGAKSLRSIYNEASNV